MVYIHNCGDEFWLYWIEFPTEVFTFQLNVKTNKNAIMTSISFAETHTEYKDKDNSPCTDYNADLDTSLRWETRNFIECCRKNFEAQLVANISCSIVGITPFLNFKNKLPECETKEDAVQVYGVLRSILKQYKGNLELLGCSFPCFTRTYNVKWIDFHKNYPATRPWPT